MICTVSSEEGGSGVICCKGQSVIPRPQQISVGTQNILEI